MTAPHEQDDDVTFLGGRNGMIAFAVGTIGLGPVVGMWALGDLYGYPLAAVAGLIGAAGSVLILTMNRILG